jgi:hypothetical protein
LALAPGSEGGQFGTGADGRLAPWQTVCLLAGIPLLAGSILLFIKLLGKDDPGTGTITWVLAVTGICAAAISVRLASPGATVLASLSLAGAGLTAINWIDDQADVAVYRDVLLIEGVIFLLLARSIWTARHEDARHLVAVGGIGLVGGALFGAIGTYAAIFLVLEPSGFPVAQDKDGWVFILVAVSIGLLAFSAWQRHGGSAFVGLYGLANFVFFSFNGDLSGWPLLLGLLALACIAWALVIRPTRGSPTASAPTPQPPPA